MSSAVILFQLLGKTSHVASHPAALRGKKHQQNVNFLQCSDVAICLATHLEVSKNGSTPKSSVLIGFSSKTIHCLVSPFEENPIWEVVKSSCIADWMAGDVCEDAPWVHREEWKVQGVRPWTARFLSPTDFQMLSYAYIIWYRGEASKFKAGVERSQGSWQARSQSSQTAQGIQGHPLRWLSMETGQRPCSTISWVASCLCARLASTMQIWIAERPTLFGLWSGFHTDSWSLEVAGVKIHNRPIGWFNHHSCPLPFLHWGSL